MTDKQKQALLLIIRLYNENKIGDGELCLLHECIFTASAIPTYVPTCPPQSWYDQVWCTDVPATASDVEIPESLMRELKNKKYQGD